MVEILVSKYRNTKTALGGINYDSRKEAKRGAELELLERAGEIAGLTRQARFLLIPAQRRDDGKAERAVEYVADFVYSTADGRTIVEDVKSDVTRKLPAYVIKRKLMLQVHGITVREA